MSSNRCHVSVCEVWPRDGIQGWPEVIETSKKLSVIETVCLSGVDEIDVTSFVPASVVPQFADALEVLAGVPNGIKVRVLSVNRRGAERVQAAVQSGLRIDRCGMPFSVSEAHNLVNLRRDHAAQKVEIKESVAICAESGVDVLIGLATAFGCPISGTVAADDVLGLVDWVSELGVGAVMLGDTTGLADPRRVSDLYGEVATSFPHLDLVAHFHDNRGAGIANVLAAVDAGASIVDCCLGGLGGEPRSVDQGDVGDAGNVVSEDLVALLSSMGMTEHIVLDELLSAGRVAEQIAGRPLFSKLQRVGGT